MIRSYVIHLVAGDVVGQPLVGVIEDVRSGARRRFSGFEELLAELTGTESGPMGPVAPIGPVAPVAEPGAAPSSER